MTDKLHLVLLGDLDAPSRGLSSRTPQLVERMGNRPEIDAVLRVRLPVSWLRFWGGRGPAAAEGHGWRIEEVDHRRYRADWAVPFPHQKADGLSLLNDPWLPRLARRLETALFDLAGRGDYLLWLAHPLLAPALRGLNPQLVVFDAVDNFLEHPQFAGLRGALQRGYDQIAARADLILSTADGGPTPWRQTRAPVHHIPNGVDVASFRGPFPEPDALRAIPRPRLGYVGVLQERLDVELVMAMARRFTEASFVFVGPIFSDPAQFAPLQALPNVHFLGPAPYRAVPAYMAHLDVCLLPHRRNAFTASMNPLKLYEYLAAGRPVVATPVPPAERFSGLIHLAEDEEGFAGAIRAALAEAADPTAVQKRQQAARAHDWQLRVNEIWRLVQQARHAGLPPAAPASLGHWEW